MSQTAQLLEAWRNGDDAGRNQLFTHYYQDLCRIASALLRKESFAARLDVSALVSEAFLRLATPRASVVDSETDFLALVTHIMRLTIVDHARANTAIKRGGRQSPLPLTMASDVPAYNRGDVLPTKEALRTLSDTNPKLSKLVALKIFAGYRVDELSASLGESPTKIPRLWKSARGQLKNYFNGNGRASKLCTVSA